MEQSAEALARFCDLLRSLLGGNNEQRKTAEQVYEATKQSHPDELCRCLLHVLTCAQDETLRQQSAVLLRQCLKSSRGDFVWPRVSPEMQECIKSQLLVALRNEGVKMTRHKICDTVSVLACHVLDVTWEAADAAEAVVTPSKWIEMAQTIWEMVETQGDTRESALRIMKEVVSLSPPVLRSLVDAGTMLKVLQLCLADVSLVVRKEAVLLYTAVLSHLPTAAATQEDHYYLYSYDATPSFKGLMPMMLGVVQQLESHEDDLQECLEAIVQVVDSSPGHLQQEHLKLVVPMMMTISRAAGVLGDGIRQTAFEFLVSLCERRAKMCARFPDFIREAVQLCMDFMLEIEDDDDWANGSVATGTADTGSSLWKVDSSNYDVGEENIDRFARALGAGVVLEHVFQGVRSFIGHKESWKHRYAAIMTLSQSAETVEEEKHVDEILGLLLSLLVDQHPRVRFAALHAIGQLSTDHSPYLQEQHNEVVLPALSKLMDDAVARVAAHACAAFINFSEELDYELLSPFVPSLMQKLCQKMLSPVRVLREHAITSVAVIAGVIETEFVPYYREVVMVLKEVVMAATGREERALRGKAFECLSLLGLAVGREVFQQDAQEAMRAMMETASRGLEADDPQRSYIYEAAQRICRALKEDFLPYLQYLLPGIHAMLRMQPAEVVDPEEGEEDMTLAFLSDGKTAVGLKTSQIEDFRSAVQLLACFLEVLKGHYLEHVRETASSLLPALSFRFSEDVKREAVQAWQELIAAAKAGSGQELLVAELLHSFLQSTVQAMRVEEDLETLQVQATGAAACVRSAGAGTMSLEAVRELCAQLRELMDESTQRQWEAASSAKHLDEDELAEAEQQNDSEQVLRIKYAELAGAIMEVHRAHFLSAGLEQFLPAIQMCLQDTSSTPDRCFALYLSSDILEKLGAEGASSALPICIRPMISSLTHSDAWVRQAAAYVAMNAVQLPEFLPFVNGVAQLLLSELAQGQRGQQEGSQEAREAAVAALGRICRAQPQHVTNLDGCLLHFLSGLPLTRDLDQAGPTHETLLDFVQEGHPFFRDHAGQVCSVFLEIYNKDTSSDRLNTGIRQALIQVRSKLYQMEPPLSQKQRKRLERILRDAA